MWWPWGRDRGGPEREEALERAEEALREMTAAFYEAEIVDRSIKFYASELRRLLDDGFGLQRDNCAGTLAACAKVESIFVTVFTEYFELRDSFTPLGRRASARRVERATAAFEEATAAVLEPLETAAESKRDLDYLFDVIAGFRTLCRPPALAATDGLEAARAELEALASDGITSKPLRRRIQHASRDLKVLKDGHSVLVHKLDVSAAFHRLHAEAEDIRRRIRAARPLAAVLTEETAAAPVG
ncbi:MULTISPECIES: hypothetical protein [unclassified Streptomyces]|uniref:hypothetical protein n=1 Tax=unclassified Streptomyces TaxID=2593676 RepID=UPI002E306633|nr:hypothetical protein [Streptomyces sp. NBC_01268]